jgi:uncharacterized caspase-like protein
MEDLLQSFGRVARGADAAVMYFAGHGIQHLGINYLAPSDAKLQDETDLRRLIRVLCGPEARDGGRTRTRTWTR